MHLVYSFIHNSLKNIIFLLLHAGEVLGAENTTMSKHSHRAYLRNLQSGEDSSPSQLQSYKEL